MQAYLREVASSVPDHCSRESCHFSLFVKNTTSVRYNKAEGHFIMINGSIYQESITFINIYAPNIRAPKLNNNSWRPKYPTFNNE